MRTGKTEPIKKKIFFNFAHLSVLKNIASLDFIRFLNFDIFDILDIVILKSHSRKAKLFVPRFFEFSQKQQRLLYQ